MTKNRTKKRKKELSSIDSDFSYKNGKKKTGL